MADLVIEPGALTDIIEAYDWYEQRQAGLGERFELALDSCFRWAENHVEACKEVVPGVRRCLVREFPYAVFFQVVDQSLHVIAVLHGARSPRNWTSRVRK